MLGCVVLTTAQQQNNNLCVGRMDGIVLPDARSCVEYFQCRGGMMMRQRCQPGTLFDLSLYYCSPEHAVDCGARTKPVAVRPPNSPDAPPSSESHHSVSSLARSQDRKWKKICLLEGMPRPDKRSPACKPEQLPRIYRVSAEFASRPRVQSRRAFRSTGWRLPEWFLGGLWKSAAYVTKWTSECAPSPEWWQHVQRSIFDDKILSFPEISQLISDMPQHAHWNENF